MNDLKLSELVRDHVIGYEGPARLHARDNNAAVEVIEAVTDEGHYVAAVYWMNIQDERVIQVSFGEVDGDSIFVAVADTLARAACIAALKIVGVEVENVVT